MLNINRSDSAVAISSYLIHTLSDLAESLQDTKMWVIAHIRISDDPINPLRLDPLVVARQVRDLNLVEMCHSLGPIFTAYYTHRDFAERYGPCANDTDSISPEAGSVAVCSSVALAFGYYNMDLAIGSKHVFLSESAWRELEAHLGLIDIKRFESAKIMPIDEVNMESVNGDVPDDSSTKKVFPLRIFRNFFHLHLSSSISFLT
ncbi:hypothetical protein BCR33DRAFT_127443 [Rhizoclosmatium globosum]|uniref:Uncharacterized protein n=1 Tax=Rhizoclosmatium globosum TaxID=329046 RepID=A0A1Y2CH71_9FUNG|nr:hypothetical protein BCR33DRAFT_127443 [Rhizoclosmatium globosum]|eukprot:ORY46362.1 hypothetical protein BCR33DRAFT_127443 [Rhizoclosmatium globosum]